MAPVGILLAAGRGRRFDPSGAHNKLLQTLPGGDAVVVASARHLLAILPRVIAVVSPQGEAVAQALRALGCEVTVCPDADEGMGASLVHAVLQSLHASGVSSIASPPASSWLVALGDMPYVQQATMQALCDALAAGADIAAPVCAGRRGNPVAFGQVHQAALLALEGDQGARALLKRAPVTEVVVDDAGIFQDIDLASDL
jgi:molybdenum cofactor cytidylyltransferase